MEKQLPVSVWPEWKIIEKIGEGSFGKVYKAQRTDQGKTFYSAIKVITIPSSQGELSSVRSENLDEQSVKEYFHSLVEDCIQEVNTMEYFRGNSHVVSVEDYKVVEYLDDIGWDIYIRMEYLTGFLDYCAGKELSEKEILISIKEKYININLVNEDEIVLNDSFNTNSKSETYISTALQSVVRCSICGGVVHVNATSVDHIIRKREGGLGTACNGQITHPYCNTGYKH